MDTPGISENPQRGYGVSNVSQPLPNTFDCEFTVLVTRLQDMWLAECDQLGLVTEADDYATLENRARQIAPELAEMNGLFVPGQSIRLEFQMMGSRDNMDIE
ncbi:MAG: DUF1902 domain-containing protein [Gammaproteobacteria bacterium]|nr:DUF1902 domain-containing protein [Gammaproteobacteria bacterium]NNJ85109.1 DUF1902 domain-containing protein [Gammaproteobacteria bacterium]